MGGEISKVANDAELIDEADALRRIYGWDATVLAREWLDLAPAARKRGILVPQEVRIWIVDQRPAGWSFHQCRFVRRPAGFPPSGEDLSCLCGRAEAIADVFSARLIVADFARLSGGGWSFMELGPGGVAGTGHEAVFKTIARQLMGESGEAFSDRIGGTL